MGNKYSVSEWVKQETLDENNGRYKWQLVWEGENLAKALSVFFKIQDEGKPAQLVGRDID